MRSPWIGNIEVQYLFLSLFQLLVLFIYFCFHTVIKRVLSRFSSVWQLLEIPEHLTSLCFGPWTGLLMTASYDVILSLSSGKERKWDHQTHPSLQDGRGYGLGWVGGVTRVSLSSTIKCNCFIHHRGSIHIY